MLIHPTVERLRVGDNRRSSAAFPARLCTSAAPSRTPRATAPSHVAGRPNSLIRDSAIAGCVGLLTQRVGS
jgi:hypothetical protein